MCSGYTAFGKHQLNSATTNSVNPFGYNGEVTDSDTGTGLIYLRNRYYDPEIGRFLTVDPAMDGTNWYSYCENDPVNFVDPSGLMEKSDSELNIFTVKKIVLNTLAYYVGKSINSQTSIDEVSRQVTSLRNNNNYSTSDKMYAENIVLYGFFVADTQHGMGWNEGPGTDSYGVTVLMYSLLAIDSQDAYDSLAQDKLTGDTFENLFGFELPDTFEMPGFSENMQSKFAELDTAISVVNKNEHPYVGVKKIDETNYCLQLGNFDDKGNIVYSVDVFKFNLIRN